MTGDGVIVSFHDNDFSRILPDAPEEMKKKGIKDLSYKEVRKLDIGAWKGAQFKGQRVLSMSGIVKALKAYPGRRVYVDIKNVDFLQLAKETEGVHSQLIIASTVYDELKRWKEVAPQSYTLHWMGGSEAELTERLDMLEKAHFEYVDQLQIHVHVGKDGAFSPGEDFLLRAGERLRKYGVLYQTFPWESKDEDAFRRLMDLGVASFATDYPDVAMRVITGYYKHE
jgi:glycerophosphoryl diester phosphodiesterase